MSETTLNETDTLLKMLDAEDTRLADEAAKTIRAYREANRHHLDMLKCPDCGNYVWDCGGAVVGHIEVSNNPTYITPKTSRSSP